jgi:hypothetical protein
MSGPESRRQRRIHDKLDEAFPSCFFFKVHGGPFQLDGIPDLVGCIDGLFCGFEVKEPGEESSKIQLHRVSQIKKAGGCAGIVESFEDCIKLMTFHPMGARSVANMVQAR